MTRAVRHSGRHHDVLPALPGVPVTQASSVQLTPALLEEIASFTRAQGPVTEAQVMAHCQVGRPLARSALMALVERGDLENVVRPAGQRYQAVPPIDEALVRGDLMPEIVSAVAVHTLTLRALATQFGVDAAVMDATVRTMQRQGQISVSVVGATRVCRPVSFTRQLE